MTWRDRVPQGRFGLGEIDESAMAYQAKKTEHAGPKRGRGGYCGPKQAAKRESNKLRRRNWKRQVSDELGSTHVDKDTARGEDQPPRDPFTL